MCRINIYSFHLSNLVLEVSRSSRSSASAMSYRRPLRRTRSFGDADAPFVLPPVAPGPEHAVPVADPVAPAPASPNARVLRRAAAPVVPPLRIARPGADALAIPPSPIQLPTIPSSHVNIATFIPFKLSLDDNNYSKWRQLFWFVLCKYHVEDHVLAAADPLHEDPVWRNDDITIVLWIYGTISDELYDVIQSPESTAFHLWDQLEVFFRDNAAGRAIHIGAEFRATVQGDMTIAQYCRRLQQLANAMADVGEPVSDRSLTLQLVHGLNRRFHVMATLLPMQQPFPTFVQARSRLLLDEIGLTERERTAGASALAIGPAGGSSSNSSIGAPPSPQDKGKGPAADERQRGGRGRGHGRGRGTTGISPTPGRGLGGQQPWLGYFALWGSPAPTP
ncbi:hypothetical protein ZWY2020_023123 [Hordeum vulgare]|nr:hypothetical protein ZWY2020_023123 [Hordeum vulgare]